MSWFPWRQRATEERSTTHPTAYPETGDDPGAGPDGAPTTGRARRRKLARWQKVVGVVGLVAILGIGILVLTGGAGDHGPGQLGPGSHGPGTPEAETSGPRGDHAGDSPPIDGAPELAITADALAFAPDRLDLTAGQPVNVALTASDIQHDLVVDEIDFHLAADRDETVVGGLRFFEPGTYVGYCSVPGHRAAGMEIEIVVLDH